MNLLRNSRVARNATWIITGKVVQAVLGLVISMLTARYLGPSNFGLINYASSIVGFIIPVVFLGLNNTLVQEFTLHPEKDGEIIGTSIGLSLISAVCCMLGVFGFVMIFNAGEKVTIIVCMLYSLLLIFQVLDLVQYWFQSKLMSKYTSLVSLCAYLLVSAYKIFLLVYQKNVYWFALSSTVDYLLISIALLILYRRLGGQKLTFSWQLGKQLFAKSKYYIVTGLMVAVFAQTDKIMLKLMINEAATGLYAAAVACAGLSSFVFTAIIDSFRPVIFKAHQESEEKFSKRMINLYAVIIYLSLLQSLIMTIFAKPIVSLLYGEQYSQSINALRIITWYTTFSFLGSVRNIWMLCMNQQKYLWIINLSGAVLNVIVNLILIPVLGIVGAAIASLLTQFFSNFVLGFIIKPLRGNNHLIIRGFNPQSLIELIKQDG